MTENQRKKIVKVEQLETFAEILDTLYGSPMGASGENHAPGLVPDPGETAGTSKFLREDGTWNTPVLVNEKVIAAAINEVRKKVTETTWGEVKALRDTGLLIPGMWYQITDHEPSGWEQVIAEGNGFDVLVLATGNNTLSEVARAKSREIQNITIIKAYKTDSEEYPDEVDYEDYFLYTGNTMEFDGNAYYIWQKYELDEAVDYLALTEELYNEGDVDIDNPSPLIPINSDGEEYGHTEDVFVEIVREETIGVDYFADKNIDAWQLLFSLDNDIERFPWATDDNKGVIYGVNYGNGYEKNGLKDYGLEEYKPIDLGIVLNDMPLLFANKNIGAECPEAPGLYFLWGDVKGFSKDSGRLCTGEYNDEYDWSGSYAHTHGVELGDNQNIPQNSYFDAARKYIGDFWRIPTAVEFDELLNGPDYSYTTYKGINGLLFTYNNSSLFIPAAGAYLSELSEFNNTGYYWTSTFGSLEESFGLYFDSTEASTTEIIRPNGLTVRAIYDNSFVDLGLPSGTKWATMNIGARKPEDAGLYFSWGNVDGHEKDDEYNFIDTYDNTHGSNLSENIPNNDAAYDAAFSYRGSEWRIPTKEDFEELINTNYTTIKWTSCNGLYGRLITSKINGKSIFIPAAGYCNSECLDFNEVGNYWLSTYNSTNETPYELYFYNRDIIITEDSRSLGFPIRPVHT